MYKDNTTEENLEGTGTDQNEPEIEETTPDSEPSGEEEKDSSSQEEMGGKSVEQLQKELEIEQRRKEKNAESQEPDSSGGSDKQPESLTQDQIDARFKELRAQEKKEEEEQKQKDAEILQTAAGEVDVFGDKNNISSAAKEKLLDIYLDNPKLTLNDNFILAKGKHPELFKPNDNPPAPNHEPAGERDIGGSSAETKEQVLERVDAKNKSPHDTIIDILNQRANSS